MFSCIKHYLSNTY